MKFNLLRSLYYWYESQNPDVTKQNLNFLAHWLKFGRYEGRSIVIPFWYRKILRQRKDLTIEMKELNLITGGDLNHLIDVLNSSQVYSNLKVYRFHKYNQQIIKFIVYRRILLFRNLPLRLLQASYNKQRLILNIYTSILAFLGGNLDFKLRIYNDRKLKVDEDVIIALILDNPRIKIKTYLPNPNPRLEKLLEWHTSFQETLKDVE